MARKSRKGKIIAGEGTIGEVSLQKRERMYQTAIYARLSVENNGIEGDSMEQQICMVKDFVKTQPDLQLVRIFADNGYTGTDFNRPAFTDMMEWVRRGEIGCIVVKDLSRFGRNYLETGYYLETIFPFYGVRFLSVQDSFDSFHEKQSDGLMVPLKSILHDTYAKDISQKVSTALDAKKKEGGFMGKLPPYGYVRDENNPSKLLVHPERARIVKRIFSMSMEGTGPAVIARRLNEERVPTQCQIRYLEGHSDGKKEARWSGSVIEGILKNPCYLGCIVERKGSNTLCGGRKKETLLPSQWKLIKDTHEGIIDRETFEAAGRRMKERRQKVGREKGSNLSSAVR